MNRVEWHGLYAESWGNDLVPEAYAHPAKYSRGLIRQIYAHMLAEGMIVPGDVVGDPFGGQAGGALDAMLNGLHWRGVELEPRFCKLGQGHDCPGFTKADWRRLQGRLTRVVDLCPVCLLKHDFKNMTLNKSRVIPEQEPHHYTGNIELWNGRYAPHMRRWGTAVLLQGDSRNFAELVQGVACVVSSPPFMEQTAPVCGPSANELIAEAAKRLGKAMQDVTPFEAKRAHGYGSTPGQLGSMKEGDLAAVISSPPYADTIERGDGPGARFDHEGHPGNPDKISSAASYGYSPGQLGRLDGCVISPPFENGIPQQDKNFTAPHDSTGNLQTAVYGFTPGNIGNDTGATFWQASRAIVEQLYLSLKPGGYAAFVTGDFVRKGQRVRFGEQWLALCEACGFVPVTWATAWKTEHHGAQLDIFGGVTEKRKDRVSFFRRLANEKNPEAAVLNEDVIFVRKEAS